MHYAIVTFGPSLPGPAVFSSLQDAIDHITAVERDTLGDQEVYYADLQSIARARVYEYSTHAAARRADINDESPRTRGFVRQVFARS